MNPNLCAAMAHVDAARNAMLEVVVRPYDYQQEVDAAAVLESLEEIRSQIVLVAAAEVKHGHP